MKYRVRSRKLKLPMICTGALLAMPLLSVPGFACSLVDIGASTSRSANISSYYFLASLALGLIIAGMDIFEKRWSIPLILSTILLVFHPWLTVAPLYGPDCSFSNVVASQVVAVGIIGMFSYRVLRFYNRVVERRTM